MALASRVVAFDPVHEEARPRFRKVPHEGRVNMHMLAKVISFLIAHEALVVALAGALWTLLSVIVGALPKSAVKSKLAKAMADASYIAHSDEPGSVRVPLKNAVSAAKDLVAAWKRGAR